MVLSGVADFEGGDLEAVDGAVNSTGVGTASLWVTDTLDVRLSGTGDVRYYGDPPLVGETVTGLGAIEALGPK